MTGVYEQRKQPKTIRRQLKSSKNKCQQLSKSLKMAPLE